MNRGARRLALGCSLAGFLSAATLAQQGPSEPALEGWAYELSDELMSPYCPGRALSECPSGSAEDLRRWIIDQEARGASREQVEEALFARFGDTLLQAPRPEGMGLVAYLVPLALFVIGGGVVLLVISRRRRVEATSTAAIDPALARKIDAELVD